MLSVELLVSHCGMFRCRHVFGDAIGCQARPSNVESVCDSCLPCSRSGVAGRCMVELYEGRDVSGLVGEMCHG